jgi:CheY-like chemotaxis protein
MPDARVLIVDDEPDLVELRSTAVTHGPTSVQAATRAAPVLTDPFDLVLCDMRPPDGDGLDFVDWLQASALESLRGHHGPRQRGTRGARAEAWRL